MVKLKWVVHHKATLQGNVWVKYKAWHPVKKEYVYKVKINPKKR